MTDNIILLKTFIVSTFVQPFFYSIQFKILNECKKTWFTIARSYQYSCLSLSLSIDRLTESTPENFDLPQERIYTVPSLPAIFYFFTDSV